ncbi:cell wall-binding repeat-containing protein [Leifsonia sp. ZF2019]|uniref:cell wall-binding repeat-containing protein n=1 Tax=Leifsonia sp. ZF2019 TaxID=2781978 RepID=UPI001CBFF981|nr:cell wall-binding repeat-containing protein [Leifsonia sp. ZF2019]UAJ80548.1 cell wall-binding repeat-containing protein [Leifsonia sp. ZF2019]
MRTGGTRASTLLVGILLASIVGLGALPAAAAPTGGDGTDPGAYYSQLARQRAAEGRTTTPDKPSDGATALSLTASAAVDKSLFVAGDLMSDAVFFNGSAMTASAVQTFLNSQVGTCNPQNKPNVEPCLKSYTTATADRPADAMCNGYTGLASETSAQIIAKVGTSCGINQGVLIALLQKEQSLVTDDWPSAAQYSYATGYDCPDDPGVGCAPETAGFFAQVYGAAWQFKRYGNPAGTSDYYTWYPVGKVSDILYSSTNSSCGAGPVAIWNKATAALYYYTPYQPNAAALANFFGTGDACSEYGNRNFWGSFNQWFGSSTAGNVPSMSRISGGDRFETSAAISRAAYPSPGAGVPAVYVANGLSFPDALAAAPAAAHRGGPLLLSTATSVPDAIVTELQRLKPEKIYAVGGTASLSDAVVTQLSSIAPVERISGSDRFQTSQAIAANAFEDSHPTTAYLAYGLNFPDALSAGAAAGAKGYPVLLMYGTAPDAGTIATLQGLGVSAVKVVGGTSVIPDSYLAGLRSAGFTATRISGDDRFDTSLAIMRDAFPSATPGTFLASGMQFPDALSAAAYAGHAGNALLVTSGACVYAGSAELALRSNAISVIGGTTAQGPAVGALSICQ